MADRGDARLPLQNIKKKTPRKIGHTINWNKMDEELRFAHKKKVENSQKPSMWEYNPKEGMPTELANLDSSTFLTSRLGRDICFLPKDVLVRICSMLSALDFVDLSLTCRFLHWRMFTFCTCYVPYTVKMTLQDSRISLEKDEEDQEKQLTQKDTLSIHRIEKSTSLKRTYRLYKDVVYDEDDFNSFGLGEEAARWPLLGKRGIFVEQPFGLHKPFLFDTLELQLNLPFYRKTYYDRCLPYIMAVRDVARHLHLTFIDHYCPGRRLFNFPDTNDFLKASNISYCDVERPPNTTGYNCIGRWIQWSFKDIYTNCPYARQMHRVSMVSRYIQDIVNAPFFENSIGLYINPLDSTFKATLENFLIGSTTLTFHQYLHVEGNSGRFPMIEYLFEKFGEFEESMYVLVRSCCCNRYYHVWKKTVTTENGGLLRIMYGKCHGIANVRVGKEETFEEMEKKYAMDSYYQRGNIRWKMETAVEEECQMDVEKEFDNVDTPMPAAVVDDPMPALVGVPAVPQSLVRAGAPPVVPRPIERRPSAALPPARAAAAARLHAGLPVHPSKYRSQL